MTKQPMLQLAEGARPIGKTRETYYLRLSMLAQHVRINRACSDLSFARQRATQTCRVQKSAAADDLLLWQTRELERKVGQDIHWISHQEEDCGFFQGFHVIDHTAENVSVAVDEIRTGLAFRAELAFTFSPLSCWDGKCCLTLLLLGSSRHDDDIALPGFFVSAGADQSAGGSMVSCIAEITHMRISNLLLGINQQDLAGNGLIDEGVSDCRADGSGPDDGDAGGQDGFRIGHGGCLARVRLVGLI